MLAETQDKRYFDRMASSLNDKKRVLDYVKQGRVLDVGAGGGELSNVLQKFGNSVWAIDGSEASIHRINERFPDVNTLTCYVSELADHFEEGFFDTIICSSILHEVFSYAEGNMDDKFDAVEEAFGIFHNLLAPGGCLVIRDGIRPDDAEKVVRLRFETMDGVDFFDRYSVVSPFYLNGTVHFDHDGEYFVGSYASAMELLYTYTWGWDSFDRESQELYGIYTLSDYVDVLNRKFGFVVEDSYSYLQQGYVDNLAPLVEISDIAGNVVNFPPSNMMIVASRNFS